MEAVVKNSERLSYVCFLANLRKNSSNGARLNSIAKLQSNLDHSWKTATDLEICFGFLT